MFENTTHLPVHLGLGIGRIRNRGTLKKECSSALYYMNIQLTCCGLNFEIGGTAGKFQATLHTPQSLHVKGAARLEEVNVCYTY